MSVLEPKTRKEVYLNAIAENDTAGLPTPKTREELYLDAIARNDKSNIPSKPLTRTEKYLEAIVENGGGDVTIEPLSVDENGTYTAPSGTAYTPVTVEVPQTVLDTLNVTENGTYTAEEGHAYDEVNVSVPLPQDAYLIKSASGTIATFTDGQDLVMPKCEAEINAVQSGSGNPSPSNIRPISGFDGANVSVSGKNLLDESKLGEYVVTAVGDKRYGVPVFLRAGTYTISAKSGTLPLYITRPSNNYSYITINALPFTFTLDNDEEVIVRIAQNDIAFWNYEDMQLEQGATATTYEPYNGNTATISWQTEAGTVYGGKVDLVSGVLTVDKGYIASYNGETLPSTWISDRDVYVEGTSPTTGAQVVYELATPLTYQLNPTAIKSLLGNNNVFADTNGDVSLQYFSKEE